MDLAPDPTPRALAAPTLDTPTLDTPSLDASAPTTLTPPLDRPDLRVYANALNAGFSTGLDDTGRFHSPATANARLADVALADGREAAVDWLPQLGIVQDPVAIAGVQTALRAGAPGTDDVLRGALDDRLGARQAVPLAQALDRDDAIMVTFPDQQINASGVGVGGLGHAGVLLIDDTSGYAVYYEYGRYDDANLGLVLQRRISDAVIDPDTGRPTRASMEQIFSEIAVPQNGGEARDIRAAYFDDRIDFDAAHGYAEAREAQNADPGREPYNLFLSNCAHFMRDVVVAGGAEGVPWITIPTPVAYMADVRFFNAFNQKPVDYDASSGEIRTPWLRPW